MSRRSKLLTLLSALLLVAAGIATYHLGLGNEGFTEARIDAEPSAALCPPNFLFPTEPEQAKIRNILQQRFFYIGRGAQCYAFKSEDERYVLKLVKWQHLRMPNWIEKFPLPSILDRYRAESRLRKQERLLNTFQSFQIAYKELKEETKLIYIQTHPFPEKMITTPIQAQDKRGFWHEIDLAKTCFILQHKVDKSFDDYLAEKINTQGLPQAKQVLLQLYQYVIANAQKGIYDCDSVSGKNYGFINDRLIQFDVGSFAYKDFKGNAELVKNELNQATRELQSKLYQIHPELHAWFQSVLQDPNSLEEIAAISSKESICAP